jgi:hypothetical protein
MFDRSKLTQLDLRTRLRLKQLKSPLRGRIVSNSLNEYSPDPSLFLIAKTGSQPPYSFK